jgi:hypothetical protein
MRPGSVFMHVLMVSFLRCVISVHMVIMIAVFMALRLMRVSIPVMMPMVFVVLMAVTLLMCFFLFIFFQNERISVNIMHGCFLFDKATLFF